MARTNLSKVGSDISNLTDKQRMFVFEYVIDLNATRAARAAGYKSPQVRGSELLRNRKVARAIGKMQSDRTMQLGLRADTVIRELKYQVERDPIDLCDEEGVIHTDLNQIPENVRKCIDGIKQRVKKDDKGKVIGVETELKLTSKLAAIEMAMRHMGLFKEGSGGGDGRQAVDWDEMYEEAEVPGNVIDVEAIPVKRIEE